MDTHLGSLVQLCCGEGGSQQTNNAGMCGECSQWKDHATSQGTVCFPGLHCSVSRMLCKGTIPSGPCIPCTSQVQAAQGLRGSARELFPMVPAFHALPRSKLLRISGALQGHCAQWSLHSMQFPGPSCSGSQGLCKSTVPSGPCIPCNSQVQAAQGLRGSARALCPVVNAFHALPRSKLLRVSGALQGHRPRWAMRFVPVPGPSSSGDQVLGECTIPGEPCVLITSPIQIAQILGVCPESTVPDVSPLES